jgi:CubicO group peptidase (beta-lactamase class C family)
MTKTVRFYIFLFITALSTGCATFDNGDSKSTNLPETLQLLASKHGVCSVAVAVIKDRKLDSVATATGCPRDLTLNSNSVFQVASLSKPVFAYAVLKLVQEGILDLDAPVVNYLPKGYQHQFQPYLPDSKTDLVTDPELQKVTVRMALNHTSGLPNWAQGPLTFHFSPGEKWHYSGEGYALLQRAVEAVTNQKLDVFMAVQVFKPLAMNQSSFVWNKQIAKNLIPGAAKDGTPTLAWNFSTPVSAYSLYSSAEDYGKFVAAVLKDERSMRQIINSPATVNQKLNLAWGQGWGLEKHESDQFIWQWGNNPGYRAFVIASVQTGNGFVMLTNSEVGLTLAEPITQKVLAGSHKVFRSHILREGLDNLMCETLNICL